MKTYCYFFAFGVWLIVLMNVLCAAGCRYSDGNAWTIVRQKNHEPVNYGFVDFTGSVFAGFTNKEQAVIAMKESRRHWRVMVKGPEKRKETSMWEPAP